MPERSSAIPHAVWSEPHILPRVESTDTWGWCFGVAVLPRSLEDLEAEILRDASRKAPKAKGFVITAPVAPKVLVVARPHSRESLPAYEAPELHAALLRRDLEMLRKVARGKVPMLLFFGFLLGLCMVFRSSAGLYFWPVLLFMDAAPPFIEAQVEMRSLLKRPQHYLTSKAQEVRFQYWMALESHGKPYRSWAMAGVWAALFLIQMLTGLDHSIMAAALVKPRVLMEPWRLATGPMLHGSIWHIFMNGFAMLALGPVVERSASRHIVVPIWLTGAIGGAVASWLMLPGKSSVGASGGLMAIIGFLAVMGWRRRRLLPPGFTRSMIRSLVYIGMFGLLAWQVIDNAGHAGGFAAGAILGFLVFRDPEGSLPMKETTALIGFGWLSAMLFLTLAIFTGWKLIWA